MKDLITIDLNKLDKEKPTNLVIAKDGSLAKEAEEELRKILDTKELLDKIIDYVKERLGTEMEERKLIKVKAGSITISKRYFGTRYKVNENTPDEFTEVVAYKKPNIEAIDAFVEVNNEVPQGVELRNREEKVSITRREDE